MNVLKLTADLVKINSVNPFKTVSHGGREIGIGNESTINEYLERLLKENGFTVVRQVVETGQSLTIDGHHVDIPARYNLLAEKGSGEHSLLLFGHTDTVDIKTGWKSEPLNATAVARDGRGVFTGLGANDMKSGLAAFIAATADLQPRGYKLKLALLVDEEFWSFGAAKLVESDFLSDVKLALVPEIGEGTKPDGQWLGLGRLGRAEFQFEVQGKACHGADAFIHPDAINAVHEAAKLELKVIEYCESVRKTFTEGQVAVTNSAYISWHEGGRAMLSVPDRASFVLDRSFVPGESVKDELRKLQTLIDDAKKNGTLNPKTLAEVSLRGRPTPPCQSYFFPPERSEVRFIEKIVEKHTKQIEYGIGRSVADENRLAELGICTIVLGPYGADSHTSSEWVDTQSIVRLSAIYRDICGSDELPQILAGAKK